MFNIGYYNHPWNKTEFVILAQTKSLNVARCIRDMYNKEYERTGLGVSLEILKDNELPEDYEFSV